MEAMFDDLCRAVQAPRRDEWTLVRAIALDLVGKLAGGLAIGLGIAIGLALVR